MILALATRHRVERPAISMEGGTYFPMSEKNLSVFIDESGDFGSFESHAPYYLVAMVLHDQSVDISGNIHSFEEHVHNLGCPVSPVQAL